MEVNNKYYIQLTAVTPLCVGAGNDAEWVKCADYVIKDRKVYVLDLHRVAESGIDMAQLCILFVNQDHDGIVKLIGNKIEEVSASVFDLPCDTENNIKSFERSQLHNLPLVAGSSLKGAIRSVLFQYLRQDETTNDSVFGTMKEGTDFMRFIKVGDIEMPRTELYNSKIFNLHTEDCSWHGGWKHALTNGTEDYYKSTGFNTLYECVSPNNSGVGAVMLSPLLFKKILERSNTISFADQKQRVLNGDIKTLFSIINQYTKQYLQKEREFYIQYPADLSDQIVENIGRLMASIPADNSSCLLKMSAGVGFHAITGDWMHDSYTEGVFDRKRNKDNDTLPKSRKIVETKEGLSLMGFVRLSEVSQSAYEDYIDQINTDYNARMQEILNQKEAKKAEAEAHRIALAERESQYKTLIEEALAAEQSEDYLLALDKANEASKLFPNKKDHQDLISRSETKAAEQKLRQTQASANAAIEKAREEKASGGLSALLNEKYEQGPNEGKYKVLTFKVCLQKVSSWMKAAGVMTLPEDQQSALIGTIERLIVDPDKKEQRDINNRKSSIWKKIEELLSCQLADDLYSKL